MGIFDRKRGVDLYYNNIYKNAYISRIMDGIDPTGGQ